VTFLTPYSGVEFAYAKTCVQPRVLVREEAWVRLEWVALALLVAGWLLWWLRSRKFK
jgi:hypothetical protein